MEYFVFHKCVCNFSFPFLLTSRFTPLKICCDDDFFDFSKTLPNDDKDDDEFCLEKACVYHKFVLFLLKTVIVHS